VNAVPAASAGSNVALAATPSLSVSPPASAAPAKGEGAGKDKIHLVFSEESWTEVRGAGGQMLLSKNNLPGSDVWLDGTPPFDFVIGNAKGVKLYYRGSEVDLTPYVKVSVARMQLK
jgi:cytoskeleton protein RodZ